MAEFEIRQTLDGTFSVFAQKSLIISGIPSKEVSKKVCEALAATLIDWTSFPRDLYLAEQIQIISAVEKIQREAIA